MGITKITSVCKASTKSLALGFMCESIERLQWRYIVDASILFISI